MPKRNCPFAETNRPQLKNHIGVKEVNLGVMSHEKMKSVYERTLGLMYQARRGCDKENSLRQNNNLTDPMKLAAPNTYISPLPGQRKLNFCGKLEGYYSREQCTVPEQSQQSMFMPIACVSCSNVPSTPRICQYCERCLCDICCKYCSSCSNMFCSDCATVRYDSVGDTWICYSCV